MLSARDEQHLITQLAAARAQEYRTVVAQAEQARTDLTADPVRVLTRLRRELRRIRSRDHFPSAEQRFARQAVEGLAGRTGSLRGGRDPT